MISRTGGAAMVTSAVRRRKWLFVAIFVIVLVATAGWLAVAPRSYTATATITATPSERLLASTGDFVSLETTVAQLANTRPVLTDVVAQLNHRRSVEQLRDEVSGALVSDTTLIRISVSDPAPQIAARIANVVAATLPHHDPAKGLLTYTLSDPAQIPLSTSSPNHKVVALAGFVLAVVAAMATAVGYDRWWGRVNTVDQLRDATGREPLAVLAAPSTPGAEVTRGDPLRPDGRLLPVVARLETLEDGKPTSLIVVAAAAGEREVTSWLGANLAAAMSREGREVLLVDAATCPAIGGVIKRSPRPGATVGGERSLVRAISPGWVAGLSLLPTDQAAAGSGSGLQELQLRRILADVEGRFDTVVIVAGAMPSTDDAALLVGRGKLVLLVPTQSMRPANLRRRVAELDAHGVGVLGAVLLTPEQGDA